MELYGWKYFSSNGYIYIDHGLLSAYIERWNTEMLSFHILIDEITITFDDVSCLLHLPIMGILFYHYIISRFETIDLKVTQLGAGLRKTQCEIENTRGCHTRFSFLSKSYINHLNADVDVVGDNARVSKYRVCALMKDFLTLVGTSIFVDKSVTYVELYTLNTSQTWTGFMRQLEGILLGLTLF